MSRKSDSSVLFSLHGNQRVFSCTFHVSNNCCNYGHDVLGDWPSENNKKVNLCFTSCQLPFFPIEQPSKILPGKYVTWHTYLTEELEKKNKYGSLLYRNYRVRVICDDSLQLTCFWCEDLASCFWFLLFSSWLSLKIFTYKMSGS